MVQNNSWMNMWEWDRSEDRVERVFFNCFTSFNWIISWIHTQWCRTIQPAGRNTSVTVQSCETNVSAEPTCSCTGSETETSRQTGQLPVEELTRLSMLHTSWFFPRRSQRVVLLAEAPWTLRHRRHTQTTTRRAQLLIWSVDLGDAAAGRMIGASGESAGVRTFLSATLGWMRLLWARFPSLSWMFCVPECQSGYF